jgi:hypothetical protein
MFKTAESNEGNSWVGNSHDCGFFKGTRRRTPAMAYQMQHRQKKGGASIALVPRILIPARQDRAENHGRQGQSHADGTSQQAISGAGATPGLRRNFTGIASRRQRIYAHEVPAEYRHARQGDGKAAEAQGLVQQPGSREKHDI